MGRKYNLGRWGAVVIAGFGVASIIWPERTEQLAALGAALAALLAAISGAIAYEDGTQAKANSETRQAESLAQVASTEVAAGKGPLVSEVQESIDRGEYPVC